MTSFGASICSCGRRPVDKTETMMSSSISILSPLSSISLIHDFLHWLVVARVPSPHGQGVHSSRRHAIVYSSNTSATRRCPLVTRQWPPRPKLKRLSILTIVSSSNGSYVCAVTQHDACTPLLHDHHHTMSIPVLPKKHLLQMHMVEGESNPSIIQCQSLQRISRVDLHLPGQMRAPWHIHHPTEPLGVATTRQVLPNPIRCGTRPPPTQPRRTAIRPKSNSLGILTIPNQLGRHGNIVRVRHISRVILDIIGIRLTANYNTTLGLTPPHGLNRVVKPLVPPHKRSITLAISASFNP